jgi:site-specific DNA-cytosine methylase
MKSQLTSTCSAESEDLLLPLDGLDLKQLDSATTNPTPKPSSKSIGRMSQSTETSKHSMERHIEESLFSQEDFPASRSVMPGSEEARTMTAISGRKCSESYKRQGQLGLLVRMLLESSAWHSTKCVLTWKQKDTKSSRSLFQLAVSMPRTEEIEYGLLRGGGGDVADSFSMRESQSQGCKQEQREWVGNSRLVLADTSSTRCETHLQQNETNRTTNVKQSYLQNRFDNDWWEVEPSICRVVDGVSNRTHRLKGLGNAIVPQVAYQIIKGIAKLVKEKR